MKERFRLNYISNRILLIGLMILVLLLILTFKSLILFFHEKETGWQIIFYGTADVLYMTGCWFGVVLPYRRSELLVQRFLDGYMTESQDFGTVFQSPSMQLQMEETEKILKSSKRIDLNKRQAQYLALQNQINPHFLYNTLESIRGEALIAGLDSIADMTEALAKFFRYTITKVENLVSVEEELDNCETYYLIQKYRFGNRLKLHIDYDAKDWEDIMNCRIPKLTLQPILENSIIHGTELKIGTGELRIQFERTEERLLIRISDNGVGMDEKTLTQLNRKLGRDGNSLPYQGEEQQGGIALANVNSRIHLLFGEEYGMHVYSVPQKGTDVEITLPFSVDGREIKAEVF